MLDDRIYTFLKLCEIMNYRKTAELLNMTQPAVTQHIHHLESLYRVKLFSYNGKTLSKTPEGCRLEEYARSVVYNEKLFQQQLLKRDQIDLSIGATKTIGDFVIQDIVEFCTKSEDIRFELSIDNTHNLLRRLNALELDFLILEGYFNKEHYDSRLLREEELVGICSPDHPFAHREIPLKDIFREHIIMRESGSGTRAVFERFLEEKNYSYQNFRQSTVISSFHMIRHLVALGLGISFAYQSVSDAAPNLAVFRIQGETISHEFNYVFLKDSAAIQRFEWLMEQIHGSKS